MNRKEIIDTYIFVRSHNHNIPDDTLKFIKDAALEKWEKIMEDKKETTKCPYDPREMSDQPIGMFHCPLCGEMVIAGMPHPDYSILDKEEEQE